MRTFYIFKIKSDISILTKDIPYNLFKMIDNLYYLDTNSLGIYQNMYHKLFDKININYTNNRIYSLYKNNRFYSFDGDTHLLKDLYTKEDTYLKVYKTHIVLRSNQIRPSLLINYHMSDNLFVCDFKNKDYFWLNEIVRL